MGRANRGDRPILILGAGINGAALACEFVRQRVPVIVVDSADLSSGTTAYSSRLIHGGLRYLEYGEFDLVRQSLEQRAELLRQVPHLVRPLRLFIPTRSRFGGFWQAAKRLCGYAVQTPTSRGLWMLRAGLWFYDVCARSSNLPKHAVHRVGGPSVPDVDAGKFSWLCSVYDAQISYPELLTVALLEEARQMAGEAGISFQVATYHTAKLSGDVVELHSVVDKGWNEPRAVSEFSDDRFRPAAIFNATGAWVDHTLSQLGVPSPRLIGGTRGSHILTSNARLAKAMKGQGVYAEAGDGRPVFFLPFGNATLVGTTDIPCEGDPRTAIATDGEIEYLLRAVADVFPQTGITRQDIDLTYAGVRPLPARTSHTPSATTRRHRLQKYDGGAVPIYSLVGGKITTCRSVAEETAGELLRDLGRRQVGRAKWRHLPGGADYPIDEFELLNRQRQLAGRWNMSLTQVQAMWSLCGTRTATIWDSCAHTAADDVCHENLAGTSLPVSFVGWVIRNQWVTTISDLVERRLMLLFHGSLSSRSLCQLAELLVQHRKLRANDVEAAVRQCRTRLGTHFGKRLAE